MRNWTNPAKLSGHIPERITFGLIFFCFLLTGFSTNAQLPDCSASLDQDTLVIRNHNVEYKCLWNNGDLKPRSIKDRISGETVVFDNVLPSFSMGNNIFQKNTAFKITPFEKDLFFPAHLEIMLVSRYQSLLLKRVFRIFPGTAAISCDYYLKYQSLLPPEDHPDQSVDGTEKGLKTTGAKGHFYLDNYRLSSRHWRMKSVAFKDGTDRQDNLVAEREIIPYSSPEMLEGNLLFAGDLISGNHFFILKEAPNGKSQVNYPGYDFAVSNKEISLPFTGFPFHADDGEWIKGYTVTLGVAGSLAGCETALRRYLKNSVNYDPETYGMVMMNTWGDRGQDGKISEQFILDELKAAASLGISHFQIDDGWQQGLSSNSVNQSGKLWDAWSPENWKLNRERFPNGWKKILRLAKEKNIRLGLWFHPSNENSYAHWETDADVIIDLYRQTGITYFKIDGVELPDKLAEINLGKFFEKVKRATNGNVFFNLDLTAGTRGGYFMFRWAGNLFLENRYTDWGNYYPFHTLRNLWMLSRYFPPELLQVEFLNKWRNADKYPAHDPFAPAMYHNFDYLFAITMAAQPLAWFEATGLPEEAFPVSKAIRKYREIQADFHAGQIFPIGEEPSGRSWTGFQSINEDHGYLLVFRENTELQETQLKTLLPAGKNVMLRSVLGQSGEKIRKITVPSDGKITFRLPEVNSYGLYSYEILD